MFEDIKQAAFADELEKIAKGDNGYEKVKGSRGSYLAGRLASEALADPEFLGKANEAAHKGTVKGLLAGAAISAPVAATIAAIMHKNKAGAAASLLSGVGTLGYGTLMGGAIGQGVGARKLKKEFMENRGIKQNPWLGSFKVNQAAKTKYGV